MTSVQKKLSKLDDHLLFPMSTIIFLPSWTWVHPANPKRLKRNRIRRKSPWNETRATWLRPPPLAPTHRRRAARRRSSSHSPGKPLTKTIWKSFSPLRGTWRAALSQMLSTPRKKTSLEYPYTEDSRARSRALPSDPGRSCLTSPSLTSPMWFPNNKSNFGLNNYL